MTVLALARGEGAFAVMTLSAELVLVQVIHLHARPALLILEYGRMTFAAFEHGGMHLMAEDRRGHPL